jgi:predicted chitinase
MARPTDDSEVFLNQLIAQMQQHLTTVGGVYITTGTMPPSPLPIPGFKSWTGYTIPPTENELEPSISEQDESIIPETFDEATTFSVEEEIVADFASNSGYSGMESTAIGLSVGPQIKSGKVSISNLLEVIPPKKRSSSDTQEPDPISTEKVADCGDVKLPTPNAKLIEAMKLFGIDTPIRRAHFLAQCAHESGGFKWVREFASGQAYEGRKDLGNTQPGDGVRYKGRGYIQLTGRANYTKFNGSVSKNVVSDPMLVETDYVAQSPAWFWKINKFNNFANDDSVETLKKVTKRVNGGYNGYEERKKYFCGYWKKLQEDPSLYT